MGHEWEYIFEFVRSATPGSSFQQDTSLFAGWDINGTSFYHDGATAATSSGMASLDFPFYAGAKFADRATAPFRVTPAGIVTMSGAIVTGDYKTSATVPTTKGIWLSAANNEMYFYGDRGDGVVEKLASIGINTVGSDTIIGYFGSANSSHYAVVGISQIRVGVDGSSYSQAGVRGTSDLAYGGDFQCSNGGLGSARLRPVPSSGSYAPTHTASMGAFWGNTSGLLYYNTSGSTTWKAFAFTDDLSIANWNTAYSDRMKWDGGSTGLTAATGRTSLGLDIGTNVQAYNANLTGINQELTTTSSPTFANLYLVGGSLSVDNNRYIYGKDSGGTLRVLVGINASDDCYGPSSIRYTVLGDSSSNDNPILIRVAGTNGKQITAGADDSGGVGYKVLRVPN